MAVPPFGITGWAHPATAAGVLFPGWRWFGPVATTAALMAFVSCMRPTVAITLAGCWLWSAATWSASQMPEAYHGVDLEMRATLGRVSGLQRQRNLISTVRTAVDDGAGFIVLPDSALGVWTPTVEGLWRQGLSKSDVPVIAGATVVDPEGYDNVLVAIDQNGGRVIYRERMPILGST